MDSRQKMDIADWQDSPRLTTPKNRRPRIFLSPALIGACSTVLLHALFIGSVPLGLRGPRPTSAEAQALSSVLTKPNADSGERLILVALPATDKNQVANQLLVSSLPDLSKIKMRAPAVAEPPASLIETLPLSEYQDSPLQTAVGDGAELARLFGIYIGQIQARIDRVWRRPRTPVNESLPADKDGVGDSFQCQAQIVQDASGNVLEILLPRCNGSPAWRRSLVRAIQQATPIPTPPSPRLFSQSITLSFVALPYGRGSENEEYELESREVAQIN